MIFTTFAIFPPELKRGFLSLVQQYADYRHIERNTNITIFHIWNGYMKLTTQSTVFSKFCHLWLKSNITVFQTCWYLCFGRVARGNLTPTLPQIRAWISRFTRLLPAIFLKPHSLKPTQKEIRFLPRFSGVDHHLPRAGSSPSLQSHYRAFDTNTGWSAPVIRIGTLILVGPPLEFLP